MRYERPFHDTAEKVPRKRLIGGQPEDVMSITNLVGLYGLDVSSSPPIPFEIVGATPNGNLLVQIPFTPNNLITSNGPSSLQVKPEICFMQTTTFLFETVEARSGFQQAPAIVVSDSMDGARAN